MQNPPLAWRHDGRPALGDLMTWTDCGIMKMELRKTFQFEAAHLLPLLPKSHKCRRLHGHSFKVEIVVAGQCDPSSAG